MKCPQLQMKKPCFGTTEQQFTWLQRYFLWPKEKPGPWVRMYLAAHCWPADFDFFLLYSESKVPSDGYMYLFWSGCFYVVNPPVRVRSSRFCPNCDSFLLSCQGVPCMGMHIRLYLSAIRFISRVAWEQISLWSRDIILWNFFPSQSLKAIPVPGKGFMTKVASSTLGNSPKGILRKS